MTATAGQTADDPSRRFVLTRDAPLVRNLAALWAVDPKLARAVEALPDDACYRIVPSKSGPCQT